MPDASMPDSDIVTPPPTMTEELMTEELVVIPVVNTSPSELIVTPDPTFTVDTVVTPDKTAPPFGSRVIESADPAVTRILLSLSLLIDILFDYLGVWTCT